MNELLNEMKAAAARHPENQWVSFSEIREAFPSEMHVEWIMIQVYTLYQTNQIDVLIEKGGTEFFLRVL